MRQPAPWLSVGIELAVNPRAAQPWPRTMSLDTSLVVRPANRQANRSRSGGGIGADEYVGDVFPQAELDLFAVEQAQPAVDGQGGMRDEVVDQAGFAGAGFA